MDAPHRDLASIEVWERSLARSRRRRESAASTRRDAARRKKASIAVTAAMVVAPAAPAFAAGSSFAPRVEQASPANRAIAPAPSGALLREGSTGPGVAHLQSALKVQADGIFGPETEAAVRSAQQRAGLSPDGIVGPETRRAVASNAGGDTSSPVPAPAPASDACGSGPMAKPVTGYTITGHYGESRPGHTHSGVDLAVPSGTPIHAAACGVVSQAGTESGYGNIVCIKHSSWLSTCYAHMSRFATSAGQRVHQGQVIGYVGCTGDCSGPHVHFEVRENGQATDPSPYLAGTAG